MKKMIIAGLISGLLMSSAFANQQFPANLRSLFAPQSWTSENSSDVVSIQNGVGETNVYSVQIYVSQTVLPPLYKPAAGVNVKNCGNVTHINPGSSAICQLSNTNPVITFSSDKDDESARGVYQIEK